MAGSDVAIKITADSSQLSKEFGKVVAQSKSAAGQITGAFRGVQGVLAGIGIGLSAGAFVGLVKGAIDAADTLQDLSQKTGVAVETLGGIGFAAKQAGADLETVAKGFGKFNLSIAKATGGDQDAAAAFSKIGVSIAELKALKPEEVFARTADAFNSFADGPNKAAIGNALFSKSYADLIPLLNEGGAALRQNIAYYQKYSGLTKELAENSDKFNDEVEKAKLLTGALGNAIAAKLLPSLQGLVAMFVEAKESGDGFAGTADTIVDGLKNITKGLVIAGREVVGFADFLGGFAALAGAIVKLDFAGAKAIDADLVARSKQLSADRDKILAAIDGKGATGVGLPKPKRPNAPSLGSKDGQDIAKAQLDARLKSLQDSIREEQDILKDHEHFLKASYEDNLLSTREYYIARQAVVDSALKQELSAYDQELALLKDFAKKASPKDRLDVENKIADVIAKQGKALREAGVNAADGLREERRAAAEFADQIEEIAIQLAGLSGDTVSAGLRQFDRAHDQISQKAKAQANSSDLAEQGAGEAALRSIADLRTRTDQQLRLNKTERDFSDILQDVSLAHGRINLQQQTGAITELDAINKRAQASKAAIANLEQEAAAYEALALASPRDSEAQNDALRNLQRLRLEIDQLSAAADELSAKFRGIFTDAVTDGLTDIVTGTKSVKEAFRDMERSIVQSISRIAAQDIAETIFGKSGVGGGLGDIFGVLFGGGKGGGGFDVITNLFKGFASGGSVAANEPIIVGEKGRELFVPKSAGNIVPNDVLSARRSERAVSIHQTINVLPGATRATADQAAMRSGIAAQRALSRNG